MFRRGYRPILHGCIACLASLLLAAALAFADQPKATGARVSGDDVRTRFVADLTRAVSYSVYVLPDPFRVVIDMPDIAFDLPPGIGRKVRGLVEEYRYGPLEKGRSRIVIDTKGPVLIEKSYVVKAQAGQPARIVVDIVPTDRSDFFATYRKQSSPAQGEAADVSREPGVAEEVAPAGAPSVQVPLPKAKSGTEASAAQPRQAHAKRKGERRMVVIDPGHGGIDPGAIGSGKTKEKDVVLAFGLALRDKLLADGRHDVVMTRDDDRFVTLKDRVRTARHAQADLFIALHADTVRSTTVKGATLYSVSERASDAEAEELARKENRADIIGGVDLGAESEEITDILIDLAQRETKHYAVLFAKKAVGELKPVTQLAKRPLRAAGFVVLKAPDVPSVLLELGYLSSKSDEELLASPQWRRKVAAALAKAIDRYFTTEMAQRQ